MQNNAKAITTIGLYVQNGNAGIVIDEYIGR